LTAIDLIIYIFLGIGSAFNILAVVGLLRFPDVYTRLHAGTKCTTFGSIFLCLAIIIYGISMWYSGNGSILSIHSFIALICILITNPTGAHAIARAAHRSDIAPVKAVVDDLRDEIKEGKRW
jgi:multicomponent Na+:H+ antiporter subunit G